MLQWTLVFSFWSKFIAERLPFSKALRLWIAQGKLELSMESHLTLWHKSSASWYVIPSSPCIAPCGSQAGQKGLRPGTGTFVQPSAIAVCLQLICFDSTSSPGIFTAPVIQSCLLTQLRGNVDDRFMVCSNDFVTHRWKSRWLWNKTSHCGNREERETYHIVK